MQVQVLFPALTLRGNGFGGFCVILACQAPEKMYNGDIKKLYEKETSI